MNILTIYSLDKDYCYFTKENSKDIQVINMDEGSVLKDYNALVVGKWYYLKDDITNYQNWRIQYKNRGINPKNGAIEYNFFIRDVGGTISLPEGYFSKETVRNLKFSSGFDLTNILSIQNAKMKKGELVAVKKIDFNSDGIIEVTETKLKSI